MAKHTFAKAVSTVTVVPISETIEAKYGRLRGQLNEIDMALRNAKYMADFTDDLVGALDGNGAPEGYFLISMAEGNRLAFCCYNLSERLEELIELCESKPGN